MSALYFDNDVSLRLVPLLAGSGHSVTTARGLGLARAGDEMHFLAAVQRQEVLITSNRHDFVLLHRAWLLWATALGLTMPSHPGILVIDQASLGDQAEALSALLAGTRAESLAGRLVWWHPPIGWRRLEGSAWLATPTS